MTTDRSRKELIDEMPSSRFSAAAVQSTYPNEKDFNSLMSFAVPRNLRLFVSETLEISGSHLVNQNPILSLLVVHYAVRPKAGGEQERGHEQARDGRRAEVRKRDGTAAGGKGTISSS